MSSIRVNRIVGYIKHHDEFPFNVEDVDDNLDDVLQFYEIFEPLEAEERAVLQRDLRELALAEEEAEVVRLIAGEFTTVPGSALFQFPLHKE